MGNIIGAALLVVLTAMPVKAEKFFTTEQLLQECSIGLAIREQEQWTHLNNKTGDASAYGHCFGFIEAARQMTGLANVAHAQAEQQSKNACIPAGIPNLQLVHAFVRYASTHVIEDNGIALIAVITTFKKVYGCD
jgi:hypothetical protein